MGRGSLRAWFSGSSVRSTIRKRGRYNQSPDRSERLKRAEAFAEKHGIDKAAVFTDVDEMLGAVDIDAVSNVTSDAFHMPISLRCIAAGKHVFCEKPLAVNYPDARRMAVAAKRKGVINMVNLSYRDASAIQKAQKLIADGVIGKVMHFEASYLQSWLLSKQY